MTVLLAPSAAAVIRLRSTAGCILALDTLALILIALLVLCAAANRSYYMDAALVLSLLTFVATLILARYHEGGGSSSGLRRGVRPLARPPVPGRRPRDPGLWVMIVGVYGVI